MAKSEDQYKQWSSLWERGYITTFGPAMPQNYGSDVKAFWHDKFEKLDNNAVIIDIAAGNGAVATIAAEYNSAHNKNFTINAADAAVINAQLITESEPLNKYRRDVNFYSNAPCEKLPFSDNSADLICSQFGIEYSDLSKSILEVKRILRTGGVFVAVMHHPLSDLIHTASKELNALKDALNNQRLIVKINQYFNAIGQVSDEASLVSARKKPAAIKSSQRLEKAVKNLHEKYSGSDTFNKILTQIEELKPYVFKTKEERKSVLQAVSNSFEMTILRQRDLMQASISPDSMKNLCDQSKSYGFSEFSYEQIKSSNGGISGWKVIATI